MSISATTSNTQSMASPAPSPAAAPIRRSFGPNPDINAFQHGMGYLNLAELGTSSRVCRSWNHYIGTAPVWKETTERMGIPLVVSLDRRHPRTHKKDLEALYPITTSGLKISQTLGKPVGKTANISEKYFLMLSQPDPFEPNKKMGETFRFVCTYSFIERTLDEKTPLILDESGNLVARQANDAYRSSAKP